MRQLMMAVLLCGVALLQGGATTQPGDDPARRVAGTLAQYLAEAQVEAVEFASTLEAEPQVRVVDRGTIDKMTRAVQAALAADDLQEGKQRHSPSRVIGVRFVVAGGPDVRFSSVGRDMHWATMSDEEPAWKAQWTNLQSAALTQCFAPYAAQVAPTTRPTTQPGEAAVRVSGREVYVETVAVMPGQPLVFSLRGIWRYDPDSDRWATVVNVALPESKEISPAGDGLGRRLLVELPEAIGLYWVGWTEGDRPFGSFAFNGPVLCNDLEIGEAPGGRVAACVPFEDSARAQFVPDPAIHCR